MKPKKQVLTAAGSSDWITNDYRVSDFGVGIGVNVSSGGVLTYSIQHTFDQTDTPIACNINRSVTTATATFSEPHGKSAGDSINVIGTRENNFAGVHEITGIFSDTALTFTVSSTGSTNEDAQAILYSVFEHDSLTGLSVNADGGYTLSPSAMRISVTAFTSGNVTANYVFSSGQ